MKHSSEIYAQILDLTEELKTALDRETNDIAGCSNVEELTRDEFTEKYSLTNNSKLYALSRRLGIGHSVLIAIRDGDVKTMRESNVIKLRTMLGVAIVD